MNRDEQEMALWREAYNASMLLPGDGRNAEADTAVKAFRKRYPPQPSAPKAVWYDEPPFSKVNKANHCWVEDVESPQVVYWSIQYGEWRFFWGFSNTQPLAGRRVCPITKPQEPKQ